MKWIYNNEFHFKSRKKWTDTHILSATLDLPWKFNYLIIILHLIYRQGDESHQTTARGSQLKFTK